MTKLVFDCSSNSEAKYTTALYESLVAANIGTVTQEGKIITVVLTAATDSVTFSMSAGQGRADSVKVYTA